MRRNEAQNGSVSNTNKRNKERRRQGGKKEYKREREDRVGEKERKEGEN